MESRLKAKPIKNIVLSLRSLVIKSPPSLPSESLVVGVVGDDTAGVGDTGLNAKVDFGVCRSASKGLSLHVAPPAPGVGEAILWGVG